ncbi:MAG: hypothetical protein HQL82_08455 [Magnetococcales bacterium]|nr:hypothetical protein [Magnetococcales bacterium]
MDRPAFHHTATDTINHRAGRGFLALLSLILVFTGGCVTTPPVSQPEADLAKAPLETSDGPDAKIAIDRVALVREVAAQTSMMALQAMMDAARQNDAANPRQAMVDDMRHLAEQSRQAVVELSSLTGPQADQRAREWLTQLVPILEATARRLRELPAANDSALAALPTSPVLADAPTPLSVPTPRPRPIHRPDHGPMAMVPVAPIPRPLPPILP